MLQNGQLAQVCVVRWLGDAWVERVDRWRKTLWGQVSTSFPFHWCFREASGGRRQAEAWVDKIPQLLIQLWLQFDSGRGLPQLLTSASITVLDPGSDSLVSTDWTDLSNPCSGDQGPQLGASSLAPQAFYPSGLVLCLLGSPFSLLTFLFLLWMSSHCCLAAFIGPLTTLLHGHHHHSVLSVAVFFSCC